MEEFQTAKIDSRAMLVRNNIDGHVSTSRVLLSQSDLGTGHMVGFNTRLNHKYVYTIQKEAISELKNSIFK